MNSAILSYLLQAALTIFPLEIMPGQLGNDIVWMRIWGTCFSVDLTKRKDGPKLPTWQPAYDFIYMTQQYHLVKGNIKPGDPSLKPFCEAANGVDTSLMVTTPPVVIPPPVIVNAITPASGGSVVSTEGTWTFGTLTSTAGTQILLNSVASGFGVKVQLSAGRIYSLNAQGLWFVYDKGWQSSASAP